MFIEKSSGYSYSTYDANSVLRDAAKTINFDDTFKELQDGIVNYIKENHLEILYKVAISMFIDGVGRNIFNSDEFRTALRTELLTPQR